MDWACVKEIRGVDRRKDGRGGFVAYEASSGGGGGLANMGIAGEFGGRKNETYSLVVEIWKDHRIQVWRVRKKGLHSESRRFTASRPAQRAHA